MNRTVIKAGGPSLLVMLMVVLLLAAGAQAAIYGVRGPSFSFTAKDGHILTPDGNSIYMWGYADDTGSGAMQYPGPTMIVHQGETVTINLTNQLSVPVSMVFPGQENVTATGGSPGLFTREAPAGGGTVTYSFVASQPGTYIYYSGTMPEIQVEMGLVGAIIVRPTGFHPSTDKRAYAHADTSYDYEYLFLLTEIDPRIHELIEVGQMDQVDVTDYWPVYWFINGRCAPDTMLPAFVSYLPSQPYNCMPQMKPGDRMLLRFVGGGRDLHPFHTHGNNFTVIARDGRVLWSGQGLERPDLSISDFTQTVAPGETVDAIFEWTGERMGWDIYGTGPDFAHDCVDNNGDNYDDTTHEYCPDHGKPFPVVLPEQLDLTFGAFYSGSPYLGVLGTLPPR